MSEQAQTIKIFNLRSDTNEFIGAGDAYIPPHMSHQFHQVVNTRNGMVRLRSG